ncbi:MAG: pyrimidine 5'-nucleotidase [Anaerolineales bacterium]
MRFTTIFFDLDDTLYPAETGLWRAIKERMNDYMRERLNIPPKDIARLREQYYNAYGTTTRGLQKHHGLNTDEFLAYVHDVPLEEYLAPNETQREILAALPARRVIFTNADKNHARRVLRALHLQDLFELIVDVNDIEPYCKPMTESFGAALRLAGEEDPSRCVMIDDLPRTTRAARETGMFSILCHEQWTPQDAHAQLTDWRNLPDILERG